MTPARFRSSHPQDRVLPRQQQDAHQRYRTYGPVQPMDTPSFLQRLFGRR